MDLEKRSHAETSVSRTEEKLLRDTGVSPVPSASGTGETPVSRLRLPSYFPHQPDRLACAVLSSLTRPLYFSLSWGVLPSFLATVGTLGLLPVILIPVWLRGVIAQHEQQLWHLAEWLRLQTGSEMALRMQAASKEICTSATLAWLSRILAVVGGITLAIHLYFSHFNFTDLFRFAFHFPDTAASTLFTSAISFAGICDWLFVARHQRNVARYLQTYNRFAAEQNFIPIELPAFETGARPLWLVSGFALLIAGAIWAFPVLLAMGAHRRYTMFTSVRIRALLAERLRMILKNRQPLLSVPSKTMVTLRWCNRSECRSPLKFEMCFCPRCGMRVNERTNMVE